MAPRRRTTRSAPGRARTSSWPRSLAARRAGERNDRHRRYALCAQAASPLGIATIGVLTGGFPEEALRRAGMIAVYRGVAELYERYDDSLLVR